MNYAETLKANLSKLPPQDLAFAQSLLNQLARKGSLSDKQWPYVEKLAKKTLGQETRQTLAVGELTGVVALFNAAKQHLQFPKIHLLTTTSLAIRLSVAGPGSRCPGAINVCEDSDEGRVWYGRIHTDGKWEVSDKAKDTDAVLDLLRRFCADAAGVAAAYGKLTGNCCFCHHTLSDERSTDVGYGRTCAEHYGLPWGGK